MPEHYAKSTVSASVWCNPCGKQTQHRIDDGRRGPCLVCLAKLSADLEPVVAAARDCSGCGRLVWVVGLCFACLEEREHHVIEMEPAAVRVEQFSLFGGEQ